MCEGIFLIELIHNHVTQAFTIDVSHRTRELTHAVRVRLNPLAVQLKGLRQLSLTLLGRLCSRQVAGCCDPIGDRCLPKRTDCILQSLFVLESLGQREEFGLGVTIALVGETDQVLVEVVH